MRLAVGGKRRDMRHLCCYCLFYSKWSKWSVSSIKCLCSGPLDDSHESAPSIYPNFFCNVIYFKQVCLQPCGSLGKTFSFPVDELTFGLHVDSCLCHCVSTSLSKTKSYIDGLVKKNRTNSQGHPPPLHMTHLLCPTLRTHTHTQQPCMHKGALERWHARSVLTATLKNKEKQGKTLCPGIPIN